MHMGKIDFSAMDFRRPKTIMFSVFIMAGFALTFVLYFTEYSVYIFKMWLSLFIVTTILGAIMRCSKCASKQMSALESFLRMLGILLAMFFLLNGLGITTASIGYQNMSFISLNIQNSVGDIFAALMFDTQMVIVVGFAILGMILINIGDAQDSSDVYTVGALALTVIPGIMAILTLTGWVAPGYPWDVYGAMAPLAKFVGVLTVTMLVASVGFMFDDLIKSATSGE